ncbi:MAG: P-loop containing nucleoside triphosphate hydrolase protein, partial [Marmoricola sp.]|nr:P-loop containing nucleoside triphosphate hydrolase protein [Marmoricola sp.]
MALSATMPLHVKGFVHATLRFPKQCKLVQRSINRENICLITQEITRSMQNFEDLHFVIPNLSRVGWPEIPKTMIFTDGLRDCCRIATTLSNLVPPGVHNSNEEIVLEYSTGISSERREYNLHAFLSGDCRVLVCTKACGIGVDIPDVERVIQWRVT